MKLFLIAGKARSGKSTVGKIIGNYYGKVAEVSITRNLKHYIKDYFGWDGNDETKPRDLLQEFGTGVIRGKMNKPDFLVNRAKEDIEVLSNYFDYFTVSDIRFPNEIDVLKNNFADVVTIKVERPNFKNELNEKQNNHISERALDDYDDFDYIITNDSLEKLEEKVIEILKRCEDEKN